MATIGTLRLNIVANTKGLATGLKRAERAVENTSRRLREIGGRLTAGVTLPLAAIGVVAGKMAVDFDDAMTKVTSLVGIAKEDVDQMRGAVLRLAGETGKSPRELAEGLFFVTSAGLRGKDALDALEASAKAAAAGLGTVAGVADAITSAVNAYGSEVLSAEKATGLLVATVREGKASAETLAPVLGRIIPIAAELGVGFDQVGAALAAMTRLGLNADMASTSLRATLIGIQKTTPAVEKALKGVGLSGEMLRKQLREKGLLSVLEKLRVAFKGNETAMSKVFPNVRALVGVLALVGSNAEDTKKVFQSLAASGAGDLNAAFKAVSETAGFKLRVALANIQVAFTQLGGTILPTLVPVIQKIVVVLTNLNKKWQELPASTKKTMIVFALVAGVIGPALLAMGLLVGAIGAIIGAFASVAGGVAVFVGAIATASGVILTFLTPVAAGVTAFVTGIVGTLALMGPSVVGVAAVMVAAAMFIKNNWRSVKDSLVKFYNIIAEQAEKTLVGRAVKAYGRFIAAVASKTNELVGGVVKPKLAKASKDIHGFTAKVASDFTAMFDKLVGRMRSVFTNLTTAVTGASEGLNTAIDKSNKIQEKAAQGLARTQSRFGKFAEKVSMATTKVGAKMVEMGDATAAGIGEMSAELIKGKMTLDDFVNSAVKAITRLAFAAAGAAIGGPFGAFFGSFGGSLFAGGFADGGVIPPGQFGVVGEEGPELAFAGRQGSTIVPGKDLGGGGGTNVNIDFSIAANDFSDRTHVQKVMKKIGEEVKRATVEGIELSRRMSDLSEKNNGRAV